MVLIEEIQFERGIISYMITSTMTRPTAISPTSSCDRTIQLLESVDIARYQCPKPRTISVETLSKKSTTKMAARKADASPIKKCQTTSLSVETSNSANQSCSYVPCIPIQPPRSPVLSEVSSASMANSGTSSRIGSKTSDEFDCENCSSCVSDQVVIATVELLQGACLPGDRIPLKMSISHNKPVKNLQGISITMFREGHVDTHPAIPLGPSQTREKQQFEDYYPKSRTGLGGLSLSSAGSSSDFRKDLSQRVVPLIVDPQSLNTVVNTSIQVPEDLFPTISCVPGAMITFKYYVEVVIDLRGRSTGQDRFIPRLNMTSGIPKHEAYDYTSNKHDDMESSTFPSLAPSNFVTTEHVRREKGVITCLFEVIVGTRDTERKRLRGGVCHRSALEARKSATPDENRDVPDSCITKEHNHELELDTEHTNSLESPRQRRRGTSEMDDHLQPNVFPPPETEELLDEKAQIRMAEQQLLPSVPPVVDNPLPPSFLNEQPSAPQAFDKENTSRVCGDIRTTYSGCSMPLTGHIQSSINTLENRHDVDVYGSPLPTTKLEDDKHELERRRLQIATSSPDDFYNGDVTETNIRSICDFEATILSLSEEVSHFQTDSRQFNPLSQLANPPLGDENLPLYER